MEKLQHLVVSIKIRIDLWRKQFLDALYVVFFYVKNTLTHFTKTKKTPQSDELVSERDSSGFGLLPLYEVFYQYERKFFKFDLLK